MTDYIVECFSDVSIQGGGRDGRRKGGSGRNGASTEGTLIAEEGIVSGDSASGGGDGIEALTDITIGGAGIETTNLGMKGLHVRHGLFDTERWGWGRDERRWGEIGRGRAVEGRGSLRGRLPRGYPMSLVGKRGWTYTHTPFEGPCG